MFYLLHRFWKKEGEKMQIKLNLNIFIFILIFLFTRQIEIYGILMLFAVIHELTHMLVGIVLGLKPKTFTIMPLGFSVGFRVDCLDYNKKVKIWGQHFPSLFRQSPLGGVRPVFRLHDPLAYFSSSPPARGQAVAA